MILILILTYFLFNLRIGYSANSAKSLSATLELKTKSMRPRTTPTESHCDTDCETLSFESE